VRIENRFCSQIFFGDLSQEDRSWDSLSRSSLHTGLCNENRVCDQYYHQTLAHFNGYLCDYDLLLTLNHQEAAGCTLYRNAKALADEIYMKRWGILMEICVYYILYLILD
jgi:hypothetical protein